MGKIQLEELTVGGLLRRTARKFPDNAAIRFGNETYTYRQMDETVDILARKLITIGVKKGDHVGILCETSPTEIMTKYALARIGAVACLLNTGLKRQELTQLLEFSDINVLFIGDSYQDVNYLDMCLDICKNFKTPMTVLRVEHPESRIPSSVEELSARESEVKPQDTAFMLYTSGTTGAIKAVMGSHYSRANCGVKQAEDMGCTEKDVFLCALPTFHCFSLSVNIMAACAVGGCLVIPKSRKTSVLLDTIEQYKCTVFSCVPTLYHAIISRPDFRNWDTSSVRVGIIGGSMCTKELFEDIEEKFGMTLLSSLGQTEATAGFTISNLTDSLEKRAESVGHWMDFVEGKVVSSSGETKATGEVGEICARGYVLMQEYYKMPEQTAKTIDKDGWLHTGDLGYISEDGYLHMAGRIKDMIIRGGENISPFEIESIFAEDDRIKTIKAVGVPDTHYGEEICLCIQTEENAELDADEVRYTVSKHLATYKIPKYVAFFKEFPTNSTGKIKTAELQRMAAEKLGM